MAKLIKYIDIEEFKKLLKAEKDKRYKLTYVLAFGSGLRLSEIVGPAKNSNQEIKPLTKEQVDLEKHQIIVYGKGGKQRVTVTSPWLNKSNIQMLPLKLSRRYIQKKFKKLSNEILGRDLNFHILRHGFANYMANEKNVPLPMVQSMLGHSRLDTTGIYTKSNPKKAIEKAWESFE